MMSYKNADKPKINPTNRGCNILQIHCRGENLMINVEKNLSFFSQRVLNLLHHPYTYGKVK